MSLGDVSNLTSITAAGHLIQFVDRDAIAAWADHSGLAVEAFSDGDKGHFPIPEEIKWENGTVMKSLGNLGQSIAVLRKVDRKLAGHSALVLFNGQDARLASQPRRLCYFKRWSSGSSSGLVGSFKIRIGTL